MLDAEIETLRALAKTARGKKLGVWKHLAKTIGAFDFTLLEPKIAETSVLATDAGPVIFPKLYRRQTNWAARNKAAVSNATLQQFLDAQKKDQCYRTDDFLANGEHAAQKILFATLVKAGKTILFEPDGIVVKEDVAAITIHGPNVDKF
jgi:hypothetical protein